MLLGDNQPVSDILSSRSSRSASPAYSHASMSTIAPKGNNLRTLIANANGIGEGGGGGHDRTVKVKRAVARELCTPGL